MRILCVGDVHGDGQFFASICRTAKKKNCDAIVQVGDWGFWEHTKDGVAFLKWVERQLNEKQIDCFWLDGNHENHDLLREKYGPGGSHHNPTPEGFWKIRERLFYLPRGIRWNWAGIDFMALGGADSIDKPYRTRYVSWWPSELISDGDVEFASRPGNVDVMFTHDAPESVIVPFIRAMEKDQFHLSRMNRIKLAEVVRTVKPKYLIHGHYHYRYDSYCVCVEGSDENGPIWHKTRVTGLACNLDPFSETYVVLDTENDVRT